MAMLRLLNLDFRVRDDLYTKAYDYDANGNVVYEGFAIPGTAKSAAGWAIKKYVVNGSNQTTDQQWADANFYMDNVWNDRASLSYA